ncbi:MAG: DEAD/DEAH box helicase [Gemmatimonadetes bacterium]|nr:DEAD/DEAH box helicase [Gemmatimonadota bacterium]
MAQLAELGLDPRRAGAAAAQGWTEATPLQAAAIPVLRRGGNLVLHASSGAGVTGAYALPLLDRLAGAEAAAGVRALVLVPSADGAARTAGQLAQLGESAGVRVRALLAGWRPDGGDVLVATATAALASLQASQLKLEAVQLLVLADLDLIMRLGGGAAVDTLTPLVPRGAQRVVTAAELTPEIERYVEAHARRAMTIPARPADARERITPEATGSIGYVIVPEAQKQDALVRLVRQRAGEASIVVTRSEPAAAALRGLLGWRGLPAGAGTLRVEAADAAPATGADISFDVPFDAELLRSLHRKGGMVLVLPREVAHLRRIAAEAGLGLQAQRLESAGEDAIAEYRRMVRQSVHDEDVAAQLTLLEPLFDEFSPSEVAAALSALLRRRYPPAAATAKPASAPAGAEGAVAFVRLFISLGTRDGIRPADLVGAIAGEAGIKGEQVGKIDIRETFSVVEVSSPVAEKVIRALNGTTLRGRAVRVDYDRKSSGPPSARRGTGGSGHRAPAPRTRRPPPRAE